VSADPRVRSATLDDLPFVRDDCRSYLPVNVLAEMFGRGDLVVAEQDGRPIGYAALDRLGAVFPYLAGIWVIEPFRRRGVGRALLAELEGRARARGHAVLYSSSTADEAAPQAWHRRVGFVECGFVAGLNPGGVGEVLFRRPLS